MRANGRKGVRNCPIPTFCKLLSYSGCKTMFSAFVAFLGSSLGIISLFLLFALTVVSYFKSRWVLLAYVATWGFIPLMAGRDVIGPVDVDDLLLLYVSVLTFVPAILQSTTFGRLGKFAITYWILSLCSNTLSLLLHDDITGFVLRQMMKDFAILLFLLTVDLNLRDLQFTRRFFFALVISGAGALLNTLAGYLLPEASFFLFQPQKIAASEGIRRFAGTLEESYLAGSMMLGSFGFLLALFLSKSKSLIRLFALGGLLLHVWGIAAGQSRCTFVGVAVITTCFFLKLRQALYGGLFLLLVIAFLYSLPDLNQRILGRIQTTDPTLSGRVSLWLHYVSNAPAAVWLIGEGYTRMTFRDTAGHSSYLEVLSDTGLLGLILFSSLWYHVLTAPKRIQASMGTDFEKVLALSAVWVSLGLLISSGGVGLIVESAYRLVFMSWMGVSMAQAWERPSMFFDTRLHTNLIQYHSSGAKLNR